jgi:hypothetical protein
MTAAALVHLLNLFLRDFEPHVVSRRLEQVEVLITGEGVDRQPTEHNGRFAAGARDGPFAAHTTAFAASAAFAGAARLVPRLAAVARAAGCSTAPGHACCRSAPPAFAAGVSTTTPRSARTAALTSAVGIFLNNRTLRPASDCCEHTYDRDPHTTTTTTHAATLLRRSVPRYVTVALPFLTRHVCPWLETLEVASVRACVVVVVVVAVSLVF